MFLRHTSRINQRNALLCITGKNLTVEQLWKKVCSLIKEGHLPYCNAKLQVRNFTMQCMLRDMVTSLVVLPRFEPYLQSLS